jgi:hypothetical protein
MEVPEGRRWEDLPGVALEKIRKSFSELVKGIVAFLKQAQVDVAGVAAGQETSAGGPELDDGLHQDIKVRGRMTMRRRRRRRRSWLVRGGGRGRS